MQKFENLLSYIVLPRRFKKTFLKKPIRHFLFFFLCFSLILLETGHAQTPAQRLNIGDSHFLTYGGKPMALFGMGNFWTLADPGVNFKDMISAYKSDGGNFMRLSLFGHTVGKRPGLAPKDVIHPFLRSPTSGAKDGGNKFDLTQFNPVYFQRLNDISQYAQQNEVFIMYVIWDEIPLESGTARWEYNPFNPSNNINSLGLSSSSGVGGFYNLSNAPLKAIQETFLTKALDTVAKYGNVFFSISNEYTGSTSWHQYWDNFINAYETSSGLSPILTNELIYSGFSPSYTDTISLTTSQTGGVGNWKSNRPVVNHKTGPKFERDTERDQARKAWWSIFVNGGHTSDDSHDGGDPPDQHNSTNTLKARQQIRYFRNFIDKLPYNQMLPAFIAKPGLISIGEGRTKLGEVYVIYLDKGGTVAVDLSDAAGSLTVEWYSPRTGVTIPSGSVTGGTSASFTAPDGNDWVLYINGLSADSTPPTTPVSLSASAISDTQIDLIWSAASDPESGISRYKVYRDNIFLTNTTSTSFSDTGLLGDTSYSYMVSAENGAGVEGSKSASAIATTPSDVSAPTIVSVSAVGDPTKVTVVFSEPVEVTSATTIPNYTIDNSVSVIGASLEANLRTVTLTTSPQSDGITYLLSVNNVKDRATIPNIIIPNSNATYTYSNQVTVSNLVVSSGQGYVVVSSGLADGALSFIDRSYTYAGVHPSLIGSTYIQTANDDKLSTGSSFLSFDVDQDIRLYIAHDDRISAKPTWISSFIDTGKDIAINSQTYSLWTTTFVAGAVTLGGNGGSGSNSMYGVIIAPVSGGLPTDSIPPGVPTGLSVK